MYVFNHHLGLPSLCTLQAHSIFISITPTIGSISQDQFDANINTLIITSHTNLVVPLCGYSVMMDKIALEERASHYCPANCLNEGEVHLGKEMSMMGIHAFGDDNIFPILAAPTCKMENIATMMEILTMAQDWYFATDRDSTHRGTGHHLFVKTELPKMSKLYGTLSCMPGLNLATGDDEITLDFNYKHIFKH
ncbi:hypothetical protein BD769DRAFT_1630364 [Suillus cothurnatus]|nr:hypothetical protein BD769DRAFT_1630364 [Suillus cothurnatus]